MARPVVGEELALEAGDVHADGTLRLARAALETEVEHLVHALVAQPRLPQSAAHRQPEHVGASARRIGLLAGRHVRRAHGSVELLAARAEAAAHLDRARHAAVLGVVEESLRAPGAVARPEAEVGRQRRRVDDLAGIEDAVRVEGALHRPERVVEDGAEHLLHERAAHETVAMLARERRAEFECELGDVARNGLELPDPLLGLHVHDGPDVQAADRGVRVDAGARPVAGDDLQEAIDVVARASRGRRPCLRRTTATCCRPSSPSRGRARPLAELQMRACAAASSA